VIYRFGIFEFDRDTGELRKNGRTAALEPQPARALALLLERALESGGANAIVSREELRVAVWGADTHVDFDRGLAYCISQVRSALGDSGENPRFVQTIPKRGFKFIAPVQSGSEERRAGNGERATGSGERGTGNGEQGTGNGEQGAGSGERRHSGPAAHVLQAPHPMSVRQPPSKWLAAAGVAVYLGILVWAYYTPLVPAQRTSPAPPQVVIGVSIFDNETGIPEHDRLVAGLSDLVVARLTELAPDRLAVVGNAAILRQPRNIRNLKAIGQSLTADYVLLGQLQKGESGLRFITHFIRLRDEAHLKANRLTMRDGGVVGLEAAVVEEFERAVRAHVLNTPSN